MAGCLRLYFEWRMAEAGFKQEVASACIKIKGHLLFTDKLGTKKTHRPRTLISAHYLSTYFLVPEDAMGDGI